MIFRIPQGNHRALPIHFGFWFRRKVFNWRVAFLDTCRYDLGTPDQLDINKLVGIGYLPGHHTHSARFGWRYWIGRDDIELVAYCYVNGERITKHIGYLTIGETYGIGLYTTQTHYYFTLDDKDNNALADVEVMHNNKGWFQYRLGIYFGGNKTAPREMHIKLERG
jgi:hypothetical protein